MPICQFFRFNTILKYKNIVKTEKIEKILLQIMKTYGILDKRFYDMECKERFKRTALYNLIKPLSLSERNGF